MEDLTHSCACVVIFWWFVDVSFKSEFERRNGWGLLCIYLRASYSTPLSLMERRNYRMSLCEHGEFVCHQRSVGCS